MFNTIWGKTQHQQKLAEGAYLVTTASHGGVIIDPTLAEKYLSKKAISYGNLEMGWLHYEEDCSWAIVAMERPEFFPKAKPENVRKTILKYYPAFISEHLVKMFYGQYKEPGYGLTRAMLETLTFPFNTDMANDALMQKIVDDACSLVEKRKLGRTPPLFMSFVRDAAIAAGLPFRNEESPWIITDHDSLQRCRQIVKKDKDGNTSVCYEYEQTVDGLHGRDVIDVKKYQKEERHFDEDFLFPYGYTSIDNLRFIYGAGWEQIAAECIFETDFNF